MLPEWSRFITEVKLNRGLKESNYDQLYAYLKLHEVHANENRIMMERFGNPNNDPCTSVKRLSSDRRESCGSRLSPGNTMRVISRHFRETMKEEMVSWECMRTKQRGNDNPGQNETPTSATTYD
ncbi:hypothetical protein Tco_0452004 [Tanacetum coccineum]